MAKTVPNKYPDLLPQDGQLRAAFIGEAPGIDEEIAGVPFIGSAGRELDIWLRPFFLRSQCFIGNLSQERPPKNDLNVWFKDTKCTEPNDRLASWIDILRQQLAELRPHIVIALGNHPTYALTSRSKITNQWGSVLPCTLVPGLKAIPIPHPSFIIRGMFDLRPIIRVWMKRAKQQSEFPDYRPPVRELVVDPSLETVMAELDRLMTAPELAFDIETKPETKVLCHQPNGAIYTPDLIRCISFSDRPEWAISIPFDRAGGQHRWSMDVEKKIWAGISRLLGQPGTLKIAHNLNFDLLQLAGHSVFVAPPYYDTMIAHNRANLDLAKKKLKKLRMMRLAFCTALYTEEPYYKDDYKDENKTEDWKGYDKEYWIYNAKDSAVLHEIKAATWRDIQELGMTDMFKTEMQTSVPLNCMGIQGVKRDPALIQEIKTTTKTTIETLQVSLNETVGYELNVKSSQQVQRLLYSELNLPIMFHKKTGRPTVDEASLAKLYQRTKHPVLRQIKELARFRDFQSNYIDPPISLDDRTRTTYNQARTCTARLSSSDAILGEGKNSQVVPSRPRPGENEYNTIIKLYKQTYAADPGMLMWRRDYIQAEAMVVAWLAEDLQQINDFLTGADIHCRTVQILYGCSYEDAVAGYKNKDPEWVMRRNLGKPVRHGFNYKLGENELSRLFAKEGINMEPKQCKRLLQTMAANVLPVMRWHDEVVATLQETRTIVNPLGLRRRFLGVIDNDCIREAIAFSPQSTVAQLTNFSTLRIYNELGSELDLLLNQHDAIIGQSPVEQLQTHCTKIGQLMLQPMTIKGRVLVIPSDLEVGPNWGSLSKPSWSSES